MSSTTEQRGPLWFVSDTDIVVLSASQIETFRTCPRKWAWDRIDGVAQPKNESLELGTAVHNELEQYLKHGTPINKETRAGQIAMAAIPHLPIPKTAGMSIEQWFAVDYKGFRFRGKKDVEFIRSTPPKVMDHKTTKALVWAKTPDSLQTDVQAALYAADLMSKSGSSIVDLQWTYLTTSGTPQCEPVLATITEDQVVEVMDSVHETALNLRFVGENFTTALDVPHNASSCEAYGGCPYKEHCNLSPEEKARAIMSAKTTESLLAELRAKKAAKADQRLAEAKATPEQQVNPPEATSEQPPPPAAKKIGGVWVQPQWDVNQGGWYFPGEKAEEKPKVAEKPKAEKPPEDKFADPPAAEPPKRLQATQATPPAHGVAAGEVADPRSEEKALGAAVGVLLDSAKSESRAVSEESAALGGVLHSLLDVFAEMVARHLKNLK
jgi:RecB family exonuclease